MFGKVFGRPLDPARVSEGLHKALKLAGLPTIRVHDLRHTAATLLLAQGVHPKVVQENLGHSTITLTLDTFSHVVLASAPRSLLTWTRCSRPASGRALVKHEFRDLELAAG